MRIRLMAAALLALFALVALGCGNGRPTVVPVKGKVMFNKTTVPTGALVVFHPADMAIEKTIGGKPFGKVKEDGTFVLTTYIEGDGAPEGDYGVTIDWRGSPAKGKLSLGSEGEGGGGVGGQPLLKPRYGDPRNPAFKVTVKKGQANEPTFDVD